MRSISKSEEPQSLKVFKRSNPVNWAEIHHPANQYVYADCLKQCVADQEGSCGYTELVIDSSRHIDHYICKGIDSNMTFEWINMVAAIKDSRFGADYKDRVVKESDYDKSRCQYYCLYNPVIDDLNGVFTYYSDGSINPADKQDIKAQTTIDVFNLNEKSLKEQRRQVMLSVRNLKKGGLSANDILNSLKSGGFLSCLEYEIKQLFGTCKTNTGS